MPYIKFEYEGKVKEIYYSDKDYIQVDIPTLNLKSIRQAIKYIDLFYPNVDEEDISLEIKRPEGFSGGKYEQYFTVEIPAKPEEIEKNIQKSKDRHIAEVEDVKRRRVDYLKTNFSKEEIKRIYEI